MAFYPIFTAQSDAGEYAQTLFSVVGASLILSWLIIMGMSAIGGSMMPVQNMPAPLQAAAEYTINLAAICFVLALLGPGAFSLDALIF